MPKMGAAQVPYAKGPFELIQRDIPQPSIGQVRVKVQACGVCHSDSVTKEGLFPNIQYPRVPGHEVIGILDAIGSGVAGWGIDQRVGVGWHGGNCGYCDSCRRGDAFACEAETLVTGVTHDGGYAEYMIAPASALARVPDDLSSVEAAPLLCAGITTFNSLRNSGARPGDTVAILGIGGLGHLAAEYRAESGARTRAHARGQDKAPLAKQLGAHIYIDSTQQDPAAELQKLGGATVILSTVANADALEAALGGLGPNGKFIINGVPERALQVSPLAMIGKRQSLVGWPSGTGMDSEDTLNFSALAGIRPMTEIYPLEKAPEAYDRMMSGKARFRVV